MSEQATTAVLRQQYPHLADTPAVAAALRDMAETWGRIAIQSAGTAPDRFHALVGCAEMIRALALVIEEHLPVPAPVADLPCQWCGKVVTDDETAIYRLHDDGADHERCFREVQERAAGQDGGDRWLRHFTDDTYPSGAGDE